MSVRRPPFRYHGGKWRIAPWIISHFGRHDIYVEPFAGSASVLMRKPRSALETINDQSGDVVTFFRMLREQRDALIDAIRYTPYALAEFEQAGEPTADPVEQARRFYVRAFMAIAGPTAQWRSSWRRQKRLTKRADGSTKAMTPAAVSFARVENLYAVAERLRGVAIEQAPAAEIIERYDHPLALLYIDPPYPAASRTAWKTTAYEHEMSDDDHRQLAEQLHAAESMVILSGYRCDLYDELFADWLSIDKRARINGKRSATETIWLNGRAAERRPQTNQPSLF